MSPRIVARSRGEKTYFTGRPCKNGHIAYRYVSSLRCSECIRDSIHTSEYRAKRRAYRKKCSADSLWRSVQNERKRAARYKRLGLPVPPKRVSLPYSVAKAARVKRYTEKRSMAMKQATPAWLSQEHRREMNQLREEASRRRQVVDHIVPLQADLACGLNVPWNLQIIEQSLNARKQNSFSGVT